MCALEFLAWPAFLMSTAARTARCAVEATRGALLGVHAAAGLTAAHCVEAVRLIRAAEGLLRTAVAVLEGRPKAGGEEVATELRPGAAALKGGGTSRSARRRRRRQETKLKGKHESAGPAAAAVAATEPTGAAAARLVAAEAMGTGGGLAGTVGPAGGSAAASAAASVAAGASDGDCDMEVLSTKVPSAARKRLKCKQMQQQSGPWPL